MNPQSQTCVNLSRLYGTIANWDNFTKKKSRCFHWNFFYIILSGCTMALEWTQPLTEMSTKCTVGRCVSVTTLPPSCAFVMKSGNLNFLEPSGPLQACNGTALPFYFLYNSGGRGRYTSRMTEFRQHFSKRLCLLVPHGNSIVLVWIYLDKFS